MQTGYRELDNRIERGAMWLDTKVPDWWKAIDLGTLNLESSCLCIFGQLHVDIVGEPDENDHEDGYRRVINHLIDRSCFDYQIDWASARGFVVDPGNIIAATSSWEYDVLTHGWKNFIQWRREQFGDNND